VGRIAGGSVLCAGIGRRDGSGFARRTNAGGSSWAYCPAHRPPTRTIWMFQLSRTWARREMRLCAKLPTRSSRWRAYETLSEIALALNAASVVALRSWTCARRAATTRVQHRRTSAEAVGLALRLAGPLTLFAQSGAVITLFNDFADVTKMLSVIRKHNKKLPARLRRVPNHIENAEGELFFLLALGVRKTTCSDGRGFEKPEFGRILSGRT